MFYFWALKLGWAMAVQKCKFCGMILQNELILVRHCNVVHEQAESYSDKDIEKLSDVC
jgi:hypothetical protein